MPSSFSRFLQAADWDTYPYQVRQIVDDRIQTNSAQHEPRRMEYAATLDAIREHWLMGVPLHAVDVGGAGSPLPSMIEELTGVRPVVVDPADPGGRDLYHYLRSGPHLAHVVTCISVLEHVEDLPQVIEDLAALVVPGGLLAITVDCVPNVTEIDIADTFHFSWMRRRIFTPEGMRIQLQYPFQALGLAPLGRTDWATHVEPSHWGYGFASLVMYRPVHRRR